MDASKRTHEGLTECPRCHGNKTIRVKHGTSYETDTATERAACWRAEKCPECHGTGEKK